MIFLPGFSLNSRSSPGLITGEVSLLKINVENSDVENLTPVSVETLIPLIVVFDLLRKLSGTLPA